MYKRKNAVANCSILNVSINLSTLPFSEDVGKFVQVLSDKSLSWSFSIICFAEGASCQFAVTFPNCNKRSAFLRNRLGTIIAETPWRPARPVRPDR